MYWHAESLFYLKHLQFFSSWAKRQTQFCYTPYCLVPPSSSQRLPSPPFTWSLNFSANLVLTFFPIVSTRKPMKLPCNNLFLCLSLPLRVKLSERTYQCTYFKKGKKWKENKKNKFKERRNILVCWWKCQIAHSREVSLIQQPVSKYERCKNYQHMLFISWVA